MSRSDTIAGSARDTPTWRVDRIRRWWPDVQVDFVEALPCRQGLRVRAVIHLGGLTPADVEVGLTPAHTPVAAAHEPDGRMWSSASYDNGRFVFERVVGSAEGAMEAVWTVSVRPAETAAGSPVRLPFRLAALTAV